MWLSVNCRLFRRVLHEWKHAKRLASFKAPDLSYYHNPGSEPFRYLTIGQVASQAAEKWPDRDVFVSVKHGSTLTFSQAEEKASNLAAGLLEMGLEPGDRIGICSPNSSHWFLTALAAAKAGLILVSMNPAYTVSELEYCLDKVAIKAMVMDESYKKQHYYNMFCDIVPGLSELPQNTKLSTKKHPHLNYIIVDSENKLPGTFRLQDLLESCNSLNTLHKIQNKLSPDLNANIQFTSGTTGKPKAVPLTHFNLVNNSYFFAKRNQLLKKHHKILAQTPFFHVLGFIAAIMGSLHSGSMMILPSPTFSVKDSAETIKKEKCTMLVGTPTMYVDLCSYINSLAPDERLLYQSPEFAVSGGAICLPELLRSMKETFSCERVVSVYGLTETTAMTFQSEPTDSEFLMTSTVGRVLDHVEVKVVDSEGQPVPLGTPGEIWMRYSNNTAGYWEDQEATNKIFTADRWLKTGDKFILLEGGYGQVVGRIKDMIIRGGENISPKEIEEFLSTHPNILDAQVYGVKSERLGEEVGCSIRLNPGCQITDQELKDFCKGKISHFKVPKYIEVVDDFPKTGSGKIQKFKLREAMEKKLGLNK